MQVRTKNIAVAALGIVLVLVLWHQFVYGPMSSQASKAKQAADDATVQAKALQHQVQVVQGNDPNVKAKRNATADALQSAIPTEARLPDFLRAVNQIRDETGIPAPFQTITPSPPTLVNGVATINIGISVQGSLQQTTAYIDRLNHLSRLVVVDSVAFTAGAADNGGQSSSAGAPTGTLFAGPGAPPTMSVQITARLFAQPAAVPAPAGASGSTARPVTSAPGAQNT